MASDRALQAAAALLRGAGWVVLTPDVVAGLHDLIALADAQSDFTGKAGRYARVAGRLQVYIGDPAPTRKD